jgi:Bacterial Ig domain/Kelch motif/Galactose oxidase, central domain
MGPTQGIPEESNGWEQLVYAAAVKQSIMFSQYHQYYSEVNESLVGYNFDTNSWSIVDMGGLFHTENIPEGGESQGFFGYNPNNNTIVYHCCTSGSNQAENANHDWWFDVLGQSGLDKQTSPKPPFSALQPTGAFDVAHNVFVFEGGDSFVGTWTYNPANNSWQKMAANGTGPSPSLLLGGMAYSTVAQKVYLFGGSDGITYYSDVWSYDVPSNTWTLMPPAGGVAPSGRYRCGFAYDSLNNIFLLYGGQNASGILGDTWAFNLATSAWTQLAPPQTPPLAASPVWARLSYDSDHNAFVLAQQGSGGYFGGIWTPYAIQTWLFRYEGAGPNAGTSAPSAQPAAGGLNRNSVSWAKEPVLASSGTSLYAAWAETSAPFDQNNDSPPHIYASQYISGNWIPLGPSYNSISVDRGEAHAPSMAAVAGTPWLSWYEADDFSYIDVAAAGWTGSSWPKQAIGLIGSSSHQGRSQITNVGGVPYVAFLELNKSFYPQESLAYVKSWNGTSWSLIGSGSLNRNNVSGTTADCISITTDGTYPYVAWSEYAHTYGGSNGEDTDTNPQVYAAAWNGTQWVALGGSLNVNGANWAYDVSIAYLGGQLYLAWTERSQSGNAQLYVATWNGASWVLTKSGSLNQNPGSGWAYHPSLVGDPGSNSLYLGWVEQSAIGQKAQVFVARYLGGVWNFLGQSLNVNPVGGSAQHVSLAVYNGEPVAAWGEVNSGSLRQIYVKQWSGSGWIELPGTGGSPDVTPPTSPTGLTAVAVSGSQINLNWSPSTDLVGVAGYVVRRGGSPVANVTSSFSYQDTGLSQMTSYTYTVAAYDAAGNVSGLSTPVTIRTPGSDTTPPVVSVTAPMSGGTVSGTVTVTANATDNVAVSSVQFQLDGTNLGNPVTGAGPNYSISWNTTSVANGAHTLNAIATDTSGNSATSSESVTVNNVALPPPVISAVNASSITSSSATITWTTDQASTSQVAYGTTSEYGSLSNLSSTLVTAHAVNLSGLTAGTMYHYQVQSSNSAGTESVAGDFTFVTGTGPQPQLLLHLDSSEVSGVTNGSVVTPSIGPTGFTGTVIANGTGSVNYTPGESGNGVYFLNCCANANNAYYKFTSAAVGNIFNATQGQISFYLKSRYSFAQREASAASPRYAFDVRDGNGTHLFSFYTQVVSGSLQFTYIVAGVAQFYYVPAGTENALFGSGVLLNVTLTWSSSGLILGLNGNSVKTTSYTPSTPNWAATSNFDLGAFEYLSSGGYNASDDVIDEFTVFIAP